MTMQFSHALIDSDRFQALRAAAGLVTDSAAFAGQPGLNITDSGEELPAVIAADPLAYGCIVWESDVGALTFEALKLDPPCAHDISPDSVTQRRS